MATYLEGQVERITYASDETGYTVAQVKVKGERGLVPVVGSLMNPPLGEILSMEGEWRVHPQYGRQFVVDRCHTRIPETIDGIEKYLGSGLIKGIGPVMAKRMVKKFGLDTLDVVENQMERLQEVDGIGPKRVEMIKSAWDEQREIRQVVVFLAEYGVGSGYAARIYKRYGDRTITVVQENPYRLADDITGIGFKTADRIAEKMGIARDSDLRAESGLQYVLHELANEGHVYYPTQDLIPKVEEVLSIGREVILSALDRAAAQEKIYRDTLDDSGVPFEAVYLWGYYLSETGIADQLKRLLATPKSTRPIDAEKAVEWVENELHIKLAENQALAVKQATGLKALVITGGPGTGKTTIIRAILAIFQKITTEILLAAPTGRAAKRMSEATGCEAKTIHRLLEFNPGKGFNKDAGQPLECDLLIVDEASMIDTTLMHHLLKATPIHATLLLVGDVDQLPSVGPGNVLKDIISSGVVPMVRLNEIFRQARESSIIVNAHRINQGRMPFFKPKGGRLEDFFFIQRSDPPHALETVLELVSMRIPSHFGFDAIADIQVICPMNRGTNGTHNMNKTIQEALNPQKEGVVRAGQFFGAGDKVMQIRNNYDKEVFNGDIGTIDGIDPEQQQVVVRFDERLMTYDFNDMDELTLAYAISVHKSQGSEYPAVVLPVLTEHYIMLQRNLLYTAVTRGKKLVVVVGAAKALGIALNNNRQRMRYTALSQRLRGGASLEPLESPARR